MSAWQEGDNEIYTVEKDRSKILFIIFLVIVALGFSIQFFI